MHLSLLEKHSPAAPSRAPFPAGGRRGRTGGAAVFGHPGYLPGTTPGREGGRCSVAFPGRPARKGLRRQTRRGRRHGDTESFGWSVCWRRLRPRKTPAKRLGGMFLEVRSPSRKNRRVSFLRALRVLRRRQRKKESGRGCAMGGRSLSDQHSGLPALPAAGGFHEGGCVEKLKELSIFSVIANDGGREWACRGEGAASDARKRVPPLGVCPGMVALPRDLGEWEMFGKMQKPAPRFHVYDGPPIACARKSATPCMS